MPNSLSRETLRTILSDLPSVRTERQRRRVPSGTDEELLAFVAYTFGYRIPDVDCCPEHQAPARAFCDAYFGRDAVAIWKASRGFGGKSTLLALLALTEAVTLGADVTVLGGSGQQSERVLETLAQIWRDRSGIQYLCSAKSRSSGTRSSFLRITTKLLIYGLFQKGRVLAQDGLQTRICNRHDIAITIAHYPSGTSKWNPVEHRLFSEISKNWAGRPLDSYETILKYIRTTTTSSGLRVRAHLIRRRYPKGVKITDERMQALSVTKDQTLPKWNYTIRPS